MVNGVVIVQSEVLEEQHCCLIHYLMHYRKQLNIVSIFWYVIFVDALPDTCPECFFPKQ